MPKNEKEKVGKKELIVNVSRLGACNIIAGDICAGNLLYAMYVLTREKSMVSKKNGKAGYFVCSRQQWMVCTGFTRHQYDRALSILKKHKLISTYRGKRKYSEKQTYMWARVKNSTKSAIEELLLTNRISAMEEIKRQYKSVRSENSSKIKSAKTATLIEMIKDINEKESINVVVPKKQKNKKEEKEKRNFRKKKSDKVWFEDVVSKIYKESGFSPEPYSPESSKRLRKIIDHLDKYKIEGLGSDCSKTGNPERALLKVTRNWKEFISYAIDYNSAFNMPLRPQLWAIEKQLSVIGLFIAKLDQSSQKSWLKKNTNFDWST